MLDLATIAPNQSIAQALAATVDSAQVAEKSGYKRVWYAEHHNMKSIASSATSVLIAHVAAHTSTIRLGAGGVMLPNHSPLTIAEQYGTLAELHPDRIDLGLGRAPGGDHNTMYALRRSHTEQDSFPQDVRELDGYLSGESLVAGVDAIPGKGTNVPLYILGSSLYGAQLAAALGLPYAFASHFAPNALDDALRVYREKFEPSDVLSEPYAMVAMNVIAAPTTQEAQQTHQEVLRQRLKFMIRGGAADGLSDDALDDILAGPHGEQVKNMLRCTAVGTPEETRQWALEFADRTGADELIVAHQGGTLEQHLWSIEHFGAAMSR
jgi:luciferase family oxidoreductase group 1